jgi:anti-sigma factor RsiW
MKCVESLDNLSDYLDDALDEESADVMDIHLGGCAPCQAVLNTLQRTVEFCKDTIVPPLPDSEKAAIREAVQIALKASAKDGKKDSGK